ncbi:hypothetical protein [Paracoccus thiocyanatus]|uniref:Uncharacterized protein n=1 Tax=Paracoccus thiocyanatus TaxID=34006 RepID=A0A1N6XVR7_9RHOB|nr:hypothetical protein [Paracoccus thiocyanatus]RDW12372.1 hypothetical protein DIE28_14050 [Paracoccus thiocyanatus]SIR06353.1 hypothetical protein SAMN05421641_12310 [Paracoccus thiocyanatus]
MIALMILSAALAAEPAGQAAPTRDGLIRDATQRLLYGEPLPADIDDQLMRLSPPDRIEVLIFLRRSGMLAGPAWSIERLLEPARPQGPAQ